jgi:hypothetical protein
MASVTTRSCRARKGTQIPQSSVAISIYLLSLTPKRCTGRRTQCCQSQSQSQSTSVPVPVPVYLSPILSPSPSPSLPQSHSQSQSQSQSAICLLISFPEFACSWPTSRPPFCLLQFLTAGYTGLSEICLASSMNRQTADK